MQILARNFNHTNKSFTVVIQSDDGVAPYTIDTAHPKYELLKEAYNKSDPELFLDYFNAPNVAAVLVKNYVKGTGIELTEDSILYNGTPVDSRYANRILEMKKAKLPIDSMLAFLDNLLKNPSNRSQQELPDFLENRNMPLTEDGCFLAYKSVRSDYWSKASGKLKLVSGKTNADGHIYNAVGEVIRCERGEVDDERENECSHGLHVGGLQYSGPEGWYHSHGDKVVIVKINPADVVSVPKDHNAQKLRVCAYEVIGEFTAPLPNTAVKTSNYNEETEDDWYDDEDEDYDGDVYGIYDIEEADEISFDYPDKLTGKIERRYLVVETVTDRLVEGFVSEPDPSFVDGEERRKFLKSKMSNVDLDF